MSSFLTFGRCSLKFTRSFPVAKPGLYLTVLFGHLTCHPQVAIGVYLAAGGALIVMTGLELNIDRDRYWICQHRTPRVRGFSGASTGDNDELLNQLAEQRRDHISQVKPMWAT